ncbi:MAG: biotin/lipoyl-containing protein [Chloroflexota bacterium]
MSGFETRLTAAPAELVEPEPGVALTWLDEATGLGRLSWPGGSRLVVVEGGGTDWWVTLDGRRIGISVQSWRERVLAEAVVSATSHGGPVDISATLPGMVVAIGVAEGDSVVEGQTLLTIEAMKMQNEVRAPRAGRVGQVAVVTGTAVAMGALLVRLVEEEAAPGG